MATMSRLPMVSIGRSRQREISLPRTRRPMAPAVRRLAAAFRGRNSATTPKVLDARMRLASRSLATATAGSMPRWIESDPIAGGAARLFQRDRRVAADGPPGRVGPSRVAPDQDEGLLASSADAHRQARAPRCRRRRSSMSAAVGRLASCVPWWRPALWAWQHHGNRDRRVAAFPDVHPCYTRLPQNQAST